ncbi:MAG TPA: YdeI/OmpD-associated family protein [Candidatus Didemnitutus sp.]|nr:YdeI/OmpD-associated family protein [Candidatus Didemnitutus sp.]
MPKTDPRVDDYITRAQPFAQPILRHLRKLVHAACPDVEETIKWNHVSFLHQGQILAMSGAFKEHLTFGFWHKDMEPILVRDGFQPGNAMGLMGRIASFDDLPADRKMIGYIKAAVDLQASGKPARERPKPGPKAPLRVPPALTTALKKNKKAAAAWDKFSYSHRKEYVEWLTEAKRDETKAARLATTLEWLAEGKSRNWKYANC